MEHPIVQIAYSIWDTLKKGNAETRYMHRDPYSKPFGDISPIDYDFNSVPYGDLWGKYNGTYYYYVDCAGLIRHILYMIDPSLLGPFVELSSIIDIDNHHVVRQYPRAKIFHTLFNDKINKKYNNSTKTTIKELRNKLVNNGWTFVVPNPHLSNLKPGDILVKLTNSKYNTGHMALFLSSGKDKLGYYGNMLESSSKIHKIKNLSKLLEIVNKNLHHQLNIDDLYKHKIKSIKSLRDNLVLKRNTYTLLNSQLYGVFNIKQLRTISAYLCPNGGIRISKWRWNTIKHYISGRIPNKY
jgi:hypothetical protein